MQSAPKTMGQLRKMLAETMAEVRYGHMRPEQGVAVAKVAAQIANLVKVEVDAWKYLSEIDADIKTQAIGALPINTLATTKVLDA